MQAPDWGEHRFSGAFCLPFSFSTLSRTLADDFRPRRLCGPGEREWMQAPDWGEHRFSGAFCLPFSFSPLSRTLADDFRPAVFAGRASVSGCKLQIGRSIASAVHFACSSVFQPFAERSPRFTARLFCGPGERELKGPPPSVRPSRSLLRPFCSPLSALSAVAFLLHRRPRLSVRIRGRTCFSGNRQLTTGFCDFSHCWIFLLPCIIE